ncbi:hypothetical protein Micbo1qcDRAFT_203525 [Microdochium bolleyi]|uniref:BTB domain-containing protein n=1 Tax=Microdochium bolleyi TaxID=196109 RepID=A0A136J8D8_9PEZI|nr:hypothetical protein Micbo1qcDRAFT_203525 [Microdochium bolleyi]
MSLKTTPQNASKSEGFHTIAPDGDLVLVVGAGESKVRLRVYSQCLKAASKVFAAMFSPRWSEGQNLSAESPPEIALPADDAQTMKIICSVLHYKIDRDVNEHPADVILNLAVHADKYDLMHIMGPQIEPWLKDMPITTRDRFYRWAMLMLTPNLEHTREFLFELVAKHAGSYAEFMQEDVLRTVLEYSDLYRLEETRIKLRAELSELLRKQSASTCNCCQTEQKLGSQRAIAKLLRVYSPLRMLKVPAFEVMMRQETLG